MFHNSNATRKSMLFLVVKTASLVKVTFWGEKKLENIFVARPSRGAPSGRVGGATNANLLPFYRTTLSCCTTTKVRPSSTLLHPLLVKLSFNSAPFSTTLKA